MTTGRGQEKPSTGPLIWPAKIKANRLPMNRVLAETATIRTRAFAWWTENQRLWTISTAEIKVGWGGECLVTMEFLSVFCSCGRPLQECHQPYRLVLSGGDHVTPEMQRKRNCFRWKASPSSTPTSRPMPPASSKVILSATPSHSSILL